MRIPDLDDERAETIPPARPGPEPTSENEGGDGRETVERLRAGLVTVVVIAIVLIYVASALTYGRTFRSTALPSGFHAVTADALIRGDLAVFETPPALRELADPYDPVLNAPFRGGGLHDLALYEGKLYTPFGPAPAVLLHVPYRLLGLGNMNTNLATLLCAIAGLAASAGFVYEARRRWFPKLPAWFEVLAIVSVGLGTPVPWLVSIGRAYETSIACGYALVSIGAYLLVRGLRRPGSPRRSLLALGSAALGLAVASRPHLIAAGIFLVLAWLIVVREPTAGRLPKVRAAVWLAVPYVAVGALLGIYNMARFGSPVDFGTSHQLAGYNMPKYPLYDLAYLGPNLVDYLLIAPRFDQTWPFVRLSPITSTTDPTVHGHEPIAGVLRLFPVIAVGLTLTAISLRSMWRRAKDLAVLIACVVAVAGAALLALSVPFNSSTMRYTVDFAPLLVLASALGASWWYTTRPRRSATTIVVSTVWVISVAASAIIGFTLVLTPCQGTGSC